MVRCIRNFDTKAASHFYTADAIFNRRQIQIDHHVHDDGVDDVQATHDDK